MKSAIETLDLKLSDDLVQTSKDHDAKHERTFNSLASGLDSVDTRLESSQGCVFWWKPGYRDLFSYVTFLLDMWPVFCCFSFSTRELV